MVSTPDRYYLLSEGFVTFKKLRVVHSRRRPWFWMSPLCFRWIFTNSQRGTQYFSLHCSGFERGGRLGRVHMKNPMKLFNTSEPQVVRQHKFILFYLFFHLRSTWNSQEEQDISSWILGKCEQRIRREIENFHYPSSFQLPVTQEVLKKISVYRISPPPFIWLET